MLRKLNLIFSPHLLPTLRNVSGSYFRPGKYRQKISAVFLTHCV